MAYDKVSERVAIEPESPWDLNFFYQTDMQ